MAPVLQPTRRKLDVDTVSHLLGTGRIGPEERVEIVDGELLTLPAIGTRHGSVTAPLVQRFIRATDRERVVVTGSTPLRLDRYSELEPDVLVLRQREDAYARSRPTPADTRLAIEVADGTRAFHLGRQAEHHARWVVAEYGVIDLVARHVPVQRRPRGDAYAEVEAVAEGPALPCRPGGPGGPKHTSRLPSASPSTAFGPGARHVEPTLCCSR